MKRGYILKYSLSAHVGPWMSSGHVQVTSPLSSMLHVLLFSQVLAHISKRVQIMQETGLLIWHASTYLQQEICISECSFLHLPVSQFSPVNLGGQVHSYVALPDSPTMSQVPLFWHGDGSHGSKITCRAVVVLREGKDRGERIEEHITG